MKIVIFEAGEHETGAFAPLRREHDVVMTDETLDRSSVERFADAEIVSAFVFSQLDGATLERLPRLGFIATRSTGFDHIDTAYCREHGIAVSNVPLYGENTVAEHAFALLLAISRHIVEAAARVRGGSFVFTGLEGFDLAGRTFGAIGAGNIGCNVLRMAKAFRMRPIAYDVAPDATFAASLGVEYVSLPTLLRESDVISLHVPATPETVNVLSADAFERMKPGVVIINTARGALIDNRALIAALKSGKVAGAGLDVLPEEPLMRGRDALDLRTVDPSRLASVETNRTLCAMPNVVVTPHSAFYTHEALDRIAATTAENIDAFCRGSPKNLVAETGASVTAQSRPSRVSRP